jgi:protein-disulfide isomerase
VLEEVAAVRLPGWRLYRAEKKFKADERLNDATFVAVDDKGQVAIVGDAFLDEARLKAKEKTPPKTEADLEGLRAQLKRFFRGPFRLVLDPTRDRPSWKGVAVKLDTGYGDYEVGGYVKADDGSFLLLGRAWDRRRSITEQRREILNVKETPFEGPADAKITIVEFSDMQCGFCKRRTADWEPLLAKLGGQLSIKRYFKFFPLTSEHPWAFRASSAGFCLFTQSGSELFLRFKKQVYAQQEQLTVPDMDLFALDYARANDVSESVFKSCYLQDRSTRRVLADLTEGFSIRVRATPTYFIDGVAVSWYGDDLMEEYLRKTYLKGAGLPLPTRPPAPGAKPAGAK